MTRAMDNGVRANVQKALQESHARWYTLEEHPTQLALVRDLIRFAIVPAGRRSGKTERAKRKLAKTAMLNPGELLFAAAPTRMQAKRVFWEDLKKLCFCAALGEKSARESDLIIVLPNGSQIHILGLDEPKRIEGFPWTGGVVDETGDTHPDAWAVNIRPALSTVWPTRPGYRAWCWLIGVPEGLNHYYELSEYARTSGDPEFRLYHWKSSELAFLKDEVEAARRSMSAKQFRQEYEASFEGTSGRIYEDYSDGNLTNEEIGATEQLHWMHDFNYVPMSSAIAVIRSGRLCVLDEIVLTSAVARQTAMEFVDRYENHGHRQVLLYGDPAGKAGEKHGQVSNYTEIESVLRAHNFQVIRRVKAAAPAIRDRQNAVRAKICNAAGERRLFCNPSRAKYAHKGLQTVQVMKGSSFLESPSEYQHITTAIGYWIDFEWPVLIDANAPKPAPAEPIPSVSHFGGQRR